MLNPNKLEIYATAKDLAFRIYEVSKRFPIEEKYGVTNQMRRAAMSVGANIAEGCGKNSKQDLIKFLSISLGSCFELSYFLEMTKRIGYLETENFDDIYPTSIKLSKQIGAFIQSLRTPRPHVPTYPRP